MESKKLIMVISLENMIQKIKNGTYDYLFALQQAGQIQEIKGNVTMLFFGLIFQSHSSKSCILIGSKHLQPLKQTTSLHKSIQIQMFTLSPTPPQETSSPHSKCQDSFEFCEPIYDQQSQEIRDILNSGRPIFIIEECSGSIRKSQSEQEMMKRKILSYNRKEKSLQQLSRKFIQNFQQGREVVLQLDKVTIQLKVQRRRIYDIVNIFQSLQVVRKAAKNNYIWRGLKEAVKTINQLNNSKHSQLFYIPSKQKSLENLAGRFLNLFVTYISPITLEEAAKLLIHNQDCALVKTKIRRLYDIVNVFKSIGLVEKVHMPNKKAGFRWIGTQGLQKIIKDKKRVCFDSVEAKIQQEVEKQNKRSLDNIGNVNQWFSDQERKAFSSMGFMKQFNQKLFLPSIILQEGSCKSLPEVHSI